MQRNRNFCEISPFTYFLSKEKEIQKRHFQDLLHREGFAKTVQPEKLPFTVKTHKSLIRRRLGNVDMQLQENKAVNLKLASDHLHGVLIRPGEHFVKEDDGFIYRCGTVFRDTVDKKTGDRTDRQVIRTNHARVMYEMTLPSPSGDDAE